VDVAPISADHQSKALFMVAGPLGRNVRTAAAILGANLTDRGAHVSGCASTLPLGHAMAIRFDTDEINRILGTTFPDATVVSTLRALGHDVQHVPGVPGVRLAAPPPWRDDVLHPVDLAEDVLLASAGPASVPRIRSAGRASAPMAALNLLAERIAERLVARGYAECLSNVLRPAGGDLDVFEAVEQRVRVSRPVTPAYAALRTSLLPGLMDAAVISLRQSGSGRVFELGETLVVADDGAVRTRWTVGAVVAAGRQSLAESHATLLSLATLLDLDLTVTAAALPWASSLESGEIRVADTTVGCLGALSAGSIDRYGLPEGTACFEIQLDSLK
jgi:phenylalanyl-tRNA synthetase beta chain